MKYTFYAIAILLTLVSCMQEQQQPASKPSVEYIKADTSSVLPFSEAVRVGDMLYLSGMIGADDSGNVVPGGVSAETKQAMDNIRAILERNGSSMDNVVKCTIALADIKDWPAMNSVYKTYFSNRRFPARTSFATTGLVLGAKIEIECWATIQ